MAILCLGHDLQKEIYLFLNIFDNNIIFHECLLTMG